MEKSLVSNLKAIFRRHTWRLAIGFAMLLFSNALFIVIPMLFRHAVWAVYPETPGIAPSSVWPWAIGLLFLSFIAGYYKYRMRLEFIGVSREVERELRSKLFDRLEIQSRTFFDRHPIGELMSSLTNDIESYRQVLGPGVMYPAYFITMIIPGVIALAIISPALTLLALVPIAVLPLLILATQQRTYRLSHDVQQNLAALSTFAQEHFFGIRLIKSYAIENSSLLRFQSLARRYLTLNVQLATLQGVFWPLLTFFTRLVTVLLVLLAAWYQLNGPDFVSFMWIQSYLFIPVLMLGWVLPLYQRGSASYDRLVKLYHEPIRVSSNPKGIQQVPPGVDIHFRHLAFTYPEATTPALRDIHVTIKGGTFVGITGPIGAGKTTLFHLLNREYEIPSGMIYLGSQDIHDYSLTALRHAMVTVEQSPFLFSNTVVENVRFGKRDATLEEVANVAQQADLHDTILSFPARYETLVGERGLMLSGGQKQRVSMARAFLVDRPILLLDDIFSALDTETEKRIFAQIKRQFAGKTVLLITHRVSLLRQLDRVLYMAQGRIVEDGAHADLMALNGRYAALAELQQLGGS